MTATTAISKKVSRKETRKGTDGKTRRVITIPDPTEQEEKVNSVFFDGPFSDCGESAHDGDERPFWTIKVAIDMDAEARYAYRVWNFDKAKSLANKIAEDQGIELISSAVSAK